MWFSNDATRAYQKQHGQDIHQKIIDVSLRLAEMDATGVDVQAISTAPHHYCYWAEPELGRQVARTVNDRIALGARRSEEHTSELQSLMRISYAVFCLKKKKHKQQPYI